MPTLSEARSKELVGTFGVPFPPERVVADAGAAAAAAVELGLPVAVKLGGDAIAHKTERGLVRLNLGDGAAVRSAARKKARTWSRRRSSACLLYTSDAADD